MAILKLRDICKDYQQGKEPVRVLKNVNLTVQQGEYLAIMGPSGSGKTTLMNLIGCLDVPTSGSYELDGRDLKDLTDDELADIRNKYIGFVAPTIKIKLILNSRLHHKFYLVWVSVSLLMHRNLIDT
jgi:putative ABC transport system ATP-binding protein